MFADNQRISHRQLFRQLVLGQLGIYLVTVPVTSYLEGRQGVLSLLLMGVLFFAASIFFIRMKPCYLSPERYMGKYAGKIFCLLHLSYLFITGVFLLLVTSRITGRFFIESSRPFVIITVTAVVCYLGSHQGLERRARMAEICFPIILFVLAVMFLLSVTRIEGIYLEKTGFMSLQGLIQGCYRVFCTFLPVFFLPFTLGNVDRAGNAGKALNGSVFLLLGVLSAALILLQGVFGAGGYVQKSYPLFDMMAGVDLPGDFLERVDIFFIAAVMFCIFFAVGSIFFYNHELLKRGHMEKGAPYLAAGILVCALGCEKAGISLEWYREVLHNIYAPLFLLLALWAGIAYGRGKHHDKEKK